jgi:hypothetical protein
MMMTGFQERASQLIVLMPLLSVGCGADSAGPGTSSASPDNGSPSGDPPGAYATLLEAGVYATGGIGFAGTLPDEVLAFRELLPLPNASALYARLVDEASLPGQMYGLSGLYLTDRGAFALAAARYRNDPRPVATAMGCSWSETPASEVVQAIAGGEPPRALGDSGTGN